MAVTVIPADVESTRGNDLLDFVLQMSSLAEKKEFRKVQQQQVNISKGRLNLDTDVFAATKPQREEAAFASKTRLGFLKGLTLTNKRIAEATRAMKVASTTGDKDTWHNNRLLLKELKASQAASPITTEWGFFQKEMSAKADAENKALMGQVFELNAAYKNMSSQLDLVERQRAAKDAMRGDIRKALNTFGKEATAADAVAAIERVEAGDIAGAYAILQRLSAGAAVGEDVFKISNLSTDDQMVFSPQLRAMLQSMEAKGQSQAMIPELRRVTKDVQWPMSNIDTIMIKEEAKQRGLLNEWDDAPIMDPTKFKSGFKTDDADKKQSSRANKSTPITTPADVRPKSVKEIANERAKKVKPAGSKKSNEAKRVRVVSPDGTAGWIPADQLEAALREGYKRIN